MWVYDHNYALVQDLITVLEKWHNENWGCGYAFSVYLYYIVIVPLCGMLGIWIITSDERDKKIIRNLLDFSRIMSSFSLYQICIYSFLLMTVPDNYVKMFVTFSVVLLWSIIVGVRCHQALDISTQLSWKSYLINVIVGINWIVVFVSLVGLSLDWKTLEMLH